MLNDAIMRKHAVVGAAVWCVLVAAGVGLAGELPPVDLGLTMTDGPDPVGAADYAPASARLTYRATVTNHSNVPATLVQLNVPKADGVDVYDFSDRVHCFRSLTGAYCQYDELAASATVVVDIVMGVRASAPAVLAPDPAVVAARNFDSNLSNNAASVTTEVQPTLGIGCVAVGEDWPPEPFAGLPCFATLQGPRSGALTASFSTGGGTATPGLDYVPTSGTITFPPGIDDARIDIPLIDDDRPEGTDDFFVDVEGPGLISLTGAPAVAFIYDNEAPTVTGELSNGFVYRGPLTSPDGIDRRVDFFRADLGRGRSFEIVVDEVSGDAGPMRVAVFTNSFPTGVAHSEPVGTGGASSLRVVGSPSMSTLVWAEGLGCGTGCGPDDTYRLRGYETTLSGGRFNTRSGHESVLMLQNTSNEEVRAEVGFWSEDASHVSILGWPVAAHGVIVQRINIFVPADSSGSITVAHDAPYGMLLGTVATFDPTNGFAFDSLLQPKPR